MARTKKTSFSKAGSGKDTGTKEHAPKKPGSNPSVSLFQKPVFWILVIVLITYIAYTPALSSKKEFTNWDDNGYVLDQPLVKSISKENIKAIFNTENQVMLNYHPLTMLSLALNYNSSKLKAEPYALTNILIHLLNTFLVFIFLYRLSGKKIWVGIIGAVGFGIHPMHVESVAWIAERKDVLYCFFFLLSCIVYLHYLETKKILDLVGVFVLFVLSCLSKAMAVPLPFVLLLIDYYMQRKINFKTLAEKIPFLLFAGWMGYLTVHIQATGAIAEYHVFTTMQRFMFASYGFMMYWAKFFVPIDLSAFYPYPTLGAHGTIPLIYYIAPLVALLIVAIPFWLLYKKGNKEMLRVYILGMGFFILMVALVLQFISVGTVIMADRYSYLPYIGALFIVGMLVTNWMEKKETRAKAIIVFAAISIFFFVSCFNRVKVWDNSGVLWTDVIAKYPFITTQTGNVVTVEYPGVEVAYKNRGNYYREKGEMDKAFDDYYLLTTVNSKDPGAYSNVGNMYAMKKEFDKSLSMYSKAISINPKDVDTHVNRGITYSTMGRHEEALADFITAHQIKPSADNLYDNIAFENLNLGRAVECIAYSDTMMLKNPDNMYAYFYRGTALGQLGKIQEALVNLRKAIALKSDYPNAWFNLALMLDKSGDVKGAYEAAKKAKGMNFYIEEKYYASLEQRAK